MVVTELAVIAFPDGHATLMERAPGVAVADIIAATEASQNLPDKIPEMTL
jgi:acetate CoA/acetoacetate CoA-transferase beta subunit